MQEQNNLNDKNDNSVKPEQEDDDFHFGKWFLRFLGRIAITFVVCRFLLFWFFQWLADMLPLGIFLTFPIAYMFVYCLLFHRSFLLEFILSFGDNGQGAYEDLSGYRHQTQEEAEMADDKMMRKELFFGDSNADKSDSNYWKNFR